MKSKIFIFRLLTILLISLSIIFIYFGFQKAKEIKNKENDVPWLIKKYSFENLKKAYPNWSDTDLYEFMKENSAWPTVYEPFTGLSIVKKKGNLYKLERTVFA